MAKYPIGKLIASTRNKYKISQEALCYGICSISTLSRIENGTQFPSWKVGNALLERLGLSQIDTAIYMSDTEIERDNIEIKITRMLATGNYEIEEVLTQYWDEKSEISILEQQFYYCAAGIVKHYKEKNSEEALQILQKAIRLTMPDFSINQLENIKLLTFDEITILNNIATIIYLLGDTCHGKKLMFFLKEHFEKINMDEEEKAKKYPMILFNLSNWLLDDERFEEAVSLCDLGIDYCITQGKLTLFPFLLCNKGNALAEQQKREEAREMFLESYYVFRASKEVEKAEQVKQSVKELFDLELGENL